MSKSAQQYIEDAIKLYRRHRYQESLDTFELAIQINPTSVRGLHGRGFVLAKMKEYKKALESYEQACKLAPNIAKNYLDMAEVFYILKDYLKSGVSYRKAIDLDGNYGSIYREIKLFSGIMRQISNSTMRRMMPLPAANLELLKNLVLSRKLVVLAERGKNLQYAQAMFYRSSLGRNINLLRPLFILSPS